MKESKYIQNLKGRLTSLLGTTVREKDGTERKIVGVSITSDSPETNFWVALTRYGDYIGNGGEYTLSEIIEAEEFWGKTLKGYNNYHGDWVETCGMKDYSELKDLVEEMETSIGSIQIFGVKEDIEKIKQFIEDNNLFVEC